MVRKVRGSIETGYGKTRYYEASGIAINVYAYASCEVGTEPAVRNRAVRVYQSLSVPLGPLRAIFSPPRSSSGMTLPPRIVSRTIASTWWGVTRPYHTDVP